MSFLFNDDYLNSYDTAENEFENEMQKAEQALQIHEQRGTSQLRRALIGSQMYGKPYRQTGKSALSAYAGSLGLGGAQGKQSALAAFQTSPGYQFALNQGLQGVSRGMAASGLTDSGAEQKALSDYAMGKANQEYSQWQNQLKGLAGIGQESSEQAAQRLYGTGNTSAQLSQAYGRDYANMYGQIAQAQAEMEMAKAQAAAKQQASDEGFWGDVAGGVATGLMLK